MTSEQKEFIDFSEIKKIISVENEELFLIYLKEVYKDLADRDETNRKKGIMKIVFFDYLKLPMFISEKVFTVFDEDKDGFLSSKEFILGMNKLYNGSYQDTIKLIFDILDFNHDGFIEKDDAKMILCLLPLKTDRSKVEYKYQMKSLEEIGEIINSTFGKLKKLNLDEFKNMVEKHKSDIFMQIICFLYQKKPFTENNINQLKSSKKTVPNDLILQTPQAKNKESNIFLPSPLKSTYLSPASTFLKSINIGESVGLDDESEPAISGFNGMVRFQNKLVPKKNIEEKDDDDANDNKDVNKVIKNSDLVYNSPSVFLKKNNPKTDKFGNGKKVHFHHKPDYSDYSYKEENYYNIINGYKELFITPGTTDNFITGTTFEEIYCLYDFDRELRNILFKQILKVENILRSLIAYNFSELYGNDNLLLIALRELVQNSRDAVLARRTLDSNYVDGYIKKVEEATVA